MNAAKNDKGKVTLKDIARAADVSLATVSNALNNRRGVSDEIRRRIFQTAHRLGYVREANGGRPAIRLLVLKHHGFVVSDTPFFAALIEGIEKQCRQQKHELLISHFSLADQDRTDLLQLLNTDHAAGIIVLATEMQADDLSALAHVRTPVVLLDSRFLRCRFDRVLINNEDAAYTGTLHLVEQGHQDIGYLGSSVFINNFRDRFAGYRAALRKAGIQPDSCLRLDLEPTLEGACRDMQRILASGSRPLPTAFFADNDIIACGAMKAMQAQGLRIPEDVSLVGIDDMPFCEMVQPRLTTVRVFKQEIGGIAVRRLMEKIGGDPVVLQIEVGAELVIRDSVRKVSH
jgi:LacI family transcriptional regulator